MTSAARRERRVCNLGVSRDYTMKAVAFRGGPWRRQLGLASLQNILVCGRRRLPPGNSSSEYHPNMLLSEIGIFSSGKGTPGTWREVLRVNQVFFGR